MKKQGKKLLFPLLITTITATIFTILLNSLSAIEKLEYRILDSKFNARQFDSTFSERSNVVIIGITDQAMKEIPKRFPWPRDYYALLIKNLKKAGAKVIAFDLLFTEVDPQGGDGNFRRESSDAKNIVVAGREPVIDDRIQFQSKQSLDYQTIFDGTSGTSVGNVSLRQDNEGIYRKYHPSSLNVIDRQFLSFGYMIVKKYLHIGDADSVQRINAHELHFADKIIPTWWDGYSVLINFYGPDGTFPTISAENVLDDEHFMTTTEMSLFKSMQAQTGMDSLTLMKPENRAQWSLDIYNDPIAKIQEKVKGKICIIGPLFPESKDFFYTPMWVNGDPSQNAIYGVEIHATAVQNFIDGNFIKVIPKWLLYIFLFIGAIIVFISGYLIQKIPIDKKLYKIYVAMTFLSLAIFTLSSASYFLPTLAVLSPIEWGMIWVGVFLGTIGISIMTKGHRGWFNMIRELFAASILIGGVFLIKDISTYFFLEQSIFVPIIPFASGATIVYIEIMMFQYLTASKEKKVIQGFFSTYVPQTLVDQMIKDPSIFKLGGERRELTMLFSDIKGFTNISEKYKDTPEDLVVLLNEYLGAMTDIVFKYEGTLDKYIGDAVVAFWNAPVPLEYHARNACLAALEMQEKLVDLRDKWRSENKPEIFCRIGINTGIAIVGNMGSSSRFNYTAMGDSMNLAARLEAANKAFGTGILISEFTYKKIKNYCRTREIANVLVQGKEEPVAIYELVAKKEEGQIYEELIPAETAGKLMKVAKE